MTIKKIQMMSLSELRELAIRKKIVQAKTLNKIQLLELLSKKANKPESSKQKSKTGTVKKTTKVFASAKKPVKKAVKAAVKKSVEKIVKKIPVEKKSASRNQTKVQNKKIISPLKKIVLAKKVKKNEDTAVIKMTAPKKALKSVSHKQDLKPFTSEVSLKTQISEEAPAKINHHETVAPPKNAVPFKEDDFHFPDYYEKSGVISMARDPRWLFTYWTIVPKDMDAIKSANPQVDFGKVKFTLRLLDSSNTAQPTLVQEIHPLFGATSYYVNVPESGKKFSCEIGFTTETGAYISVARSNPVDMPSSQVSQTIDNSWINQQNYQTVFNIETKEELLSSNAMSSQILKNEEAAFSGVLSSQAMSSGQISSKELSSQALSKTMSSETLSSSVLSSAVLSSAVLSSGVLSSGVLSALALSSQSLTSSVLSSETLSSQVLGITTLALSSQQLSSYSLSSQTLSSETLSGALSSGLFLSSFGLSSGLLGLLGGLSSQTLTSSVLSSAQVGVLSLETLASGLLSSWGVSSSVLSSMEISSWNMIKESLSSWNLSSGVLSSGALSSMSLSSGAMSSFQLSSWALPLPEEFLSSAAISSNALSSNSLSSSSFGVQPSEAAASGFSVNSEVIVYGKAEPGSMLLVGGVPKKANSDGSFSARFLMQEGTMNIPVKLLRNNASESDFIHLTSSHSRDYR